MSYYTKEMLEGKDYAVIIISMLVDKGIITNDEIKVYIDELINVKNEVIEKEIDEKPIMKMFYDAFKVK